jgi:hypothetical protein
VEADHHRKHCSARYGKMELSVAESVHEGIADSESGTIFIGVPTKFWP